mgnify:CR=1 FL=1
MKHKRILAMILAVASCLSLAVSASAASTARKATDFKDFDKSAWYADAVNAAVDIAAVKNHNIPCCRGFLSEGHGRNACQHQEECQNCRKNFFLPLHICLPLILF